MFRKICSRKIDELGRVVVPMEARFALGLKERQNFDVYIDGDSIVLKPNNELPSCCLCGETNAKLVKLDHSLVCPNCISRIKDM